jgi:hypothetical protein
MKKIRLTKKRILLAALGVAAALAISLNACSEEYSAEAIEGWVVDAETGKPLEGVVVTANWQVEEGTFTGTNTGNQLQILETVTAKNGRYYFPAWGPKPLPPKRTGRWVDQYIGSEDPRLLYFKAGYDFETKLNDRGIDRDTSKIRRSDWNGKAIKLKKMDNQSGDYAESVASARSMLSFAISGANCEWKQIPRLLTVVLDEGERLANLGINKGQLSLIDIPDGERCTSPAKFLKRS